MTFTDSVVETEFTGPIAWRRDTLAGDEGILELDQKCRDELDGVISHLRANPLPVHSITPNLFELPACRALMAAVPRIGSGKRIGGGAAPPAP